MKTQLVLAAAALGLTLGACSNTPSDAPMDSATTPDMTGASAGASSDIGAAGLNPSDTASPSMTGTPVAAMSPDDFARTAAASDTFEVESSKLAETMGKSGAVKDYARMMITAHTRSTAELRAASAKAGPAIAVAPALNPEQTADIAALKASGRDFDAVYAQKQRAGHEKTLAAMRDYAARGTSAPLKAFAAKTAPIVAKHLEDAKQLAM